MLEERKWSFPFEVAGIWWVPGDEKNQFAGTLKYDPAEGGVLNLTIAKIELPHRPVRSSEILFGEVTGRFLNRFVSLFGCRVISESSHSDRPNKATIKVSMVLEGGHIVGPEEPAFSGLSASFRSLINWLDGPKITQGKTGVHTQIAFEERETKIGPFFEFANATIRQFVHVVDDDNGDVPWMLQQRASIELQTKGPRSYTELNRFWRLVF